MTGQKRGGDTGENEAREDGDGQHVAPDAFAVGGLRGTKDDALDLVVQTTASLELVGLGVAGEIVEIGLEQPEGL